MRSAIFKIQFYVWIGWIIFFTVPYGLAMDSNTLRTQGLINPGGNPKAGYLFINEMRIYIDQKTQLMNSNQGTISITEFQPKKWVYLEVEKDANRQKFIARKIFLLPHYVTPKEKRKFSFMK